MVLCNEHIVLSIKHIYIYIEVLKDLFCYVEYIQTCDKGNLEITSKMLVIVNVIGTPFYYKIMFLFFK